MFVCLLCTVTDFSAAEKDRGVKFCVRVGLLSGHVFCHFGELWLGWIHGGGITSVMSYIKVAMGQSELEVAASLKAAWWNLLLASLLTHLFFVYYGRPM